MVVNVHLGQITAWDGANNILPKEGYCVRFMEYDGYDNRYA